LNGPTDEEEAINRRYKATLENDATADKSQFDLLMKEYYDKNVVFVSEGKYRCNLCTKLFKADNFVHKHIQNKHSDEINRLDRQTRKDGIYRNFVDEITKMNLFNALTIPPQQRLENAGNVITINGRINAPVERISLRAKRSRSPDHHFHSRGYLDDALSESGRKQIHIPRRSLPSHQRERDRERPLPPPPSHSAAVTPSQIQAPRGRQVRSYADIDAIQPDTFAPDYWTTGGFGTSLFQPIKKKQRVSIDNPKASASASATSSHDIKDESENKAAQ